MEVRFNIALTIFQAGQQPAQSLSRRRTPGIAPAVRRRQLWRPWRLGSFPDLSRSFSRESG